VTARTCACLHIQCPRRAQIDRLFHEGQRLVLVVFACRCKGKSGETGRNVRVESSDHFIGAAEEFGATGTRADTPRPTPPRQR
jgi:hypothetical protein